MNKPSFVWIGAATTGCLFASVLTMATIDGPSVTMSHRGLPEQAMTAPIAEGEDHSHGVHGDPHAWESFPPARSLPARVERYNRALEQIPDQPEWSCDPDQTACVRTTTAQERNRNGWSKGTYLSYQPGLAQALQEGTTTVEVHVPFVGELSVDGQVEVYQAQLMLDEVVDHLSFLERSAPAQWGRLRVVRHQPTMLVYWTQTPLSGGRAAKVISSDQGGLWMEGMVDGHGFKVEAVSSSAILESGPSPGNDLYLISQRAPRESEVQCSGGWCEWFCVDLGAMYHEDGSVCGDNPFDDPKHECEDDVNNDQSDGTDWGDAECRHNGNYGCSDYAPTHSHRYEYGKNALYMGDGPFCTLAADLNDGAWWVPMFAHGQQATAFMNQVNPNPSFGWKYSDIRLVGAGCWVFNTMEDALACSSDGVCPPGYGGYPYKGADGVASGYTEKVWSDIQNGVSVGGFDVAIALAQAIYYQPNDDKPLVSPNSGDTACGVHQISRLTTVINGTNILTNSGHLTTNSKWCDPAVSTVHEFVHSFTIVADANDPALNPPIHSPDGSGSFMDSDGGGFEPWLIESMEEAVEACLRDGTCPRPHGFTGCRSEDWAACNE
ncbi:MAG: hypothetical protein AAFS10_08305 [Myxococcota bacterium]